MSNKTNERNWHERANIVSLQHDRYRKLLVEVEDPAETVARLRQAIGANKT
jgi:hypothetical protein